MEIDRHIDKLEDIQIKSLFNIDFSKFIVRPDPTLFEPLWENLKKGKCPFCSCKLYENREGTIKFCKSVKHKRRFAMKI